MKVESIKPAYAAGSLWGLTEVRVNAVRAEWVSR